MARAQQRLTVCSTEFLARARQAQQVAAAESGLYPEVLVALIHGRRDTMVAACTDQHGGRPPYVEISTADDEETVERMLAEVAAFRPGGDR